MSEHIHCGHHNGPGGVIKDYGGQHMLICCDCGERKYVKWYHEDQPLDLHGKHVMNDVKLYELPDNWKLSIERDVEYGRDG